MVTLIYPDLNPKPKTLIYPDLNLKPKHRVPEQAAVLSERLATAEKVNIYYWGGKYSFYNIGKYCSCKLYYIERLATAEKVCGLVGVV